MTRDTLTLRFLGAVPEFRQTTGGLRQIIDSFLAAHAYYSPSDTKFQWAPGEWVEVVGAGDVSTVVGLVDPGLEHHLPDAAYPANAPFHAAAAMMPLVVTDQHLRFALREYWQAWLTRGVDALFYAYRALETLRQPFDKSERDKNWPAMHAAFGSTASDIAQLTEAATAIRHGRQPDVPDGEWRTMMMSARAVIALAVRKLAADGQMPTPPEPPA